MTPSTGTPTFTLKGEPWPTPSAEVKENEGTVNVNKGNALVDTNTGTINIGSINIGTPEKVTVVEEKVVEKIVEVEVPVEKRVFVIVPDTRKVDDRCEMLGREHDQRVAEWKANPFGK
jgi:galactokinase